ncbi:Peptidoglycan-associated lipoprotein [Emticicia aquatica]|uniref:Peptidoglycan-associated lipoprotein n=1 Tax=Emticicia aquatica TaxID=1681835 RepID=A0ABN8ES36_9BACT|nr:OmpA family protein [Emticicia aquatica]CAH0995727.1 Peptidoglycan-associated lipoprotein [Emticicia aquatica]
MKLLRLFAGIAILMALLVSCNSSKKITKNEKNNRKKNPAAAEAAVKIGKMLDQLATDLIGATANKAEIVRTADGINITFQPDFYFESSSESLTVDAKSTLDDISSVLNQYPYTEIFIEGHADSSGNQLNNKKLSELRAKTVALYFKSHGVVAERLAIAGYGATRPVETNSTPEGRRKNRRVVVKIRANEMKFLESLKQKNIK